MEPEVDTGHADDDRSGETSAVEPGRAGWLSRQRARWHASGARPFLHRLRRPLAIVLLVLGCLAVPVSVVAVWTRTQLMNTDAYVAMVAPLADDPAIQTAVADGLTTRLFDQLDLEQKLQGALPDKLGFVAGPVAAQVETWARGQAQKIVSSDQFSTAWAAANRAMHEALVRFVTQTGKLEMGPDGVVELDLTELTTNLVARLEAAGVPIVGSIITSRAPATIPLVQSDALVSAQATILALYRLSILLPILALLFLLGSILLSLDRRRALMYLGIGIAVAMALFEVALAMGRSAYLSAADDAGIPHDASVALWDTLTSALRASSRSMFFLGLVLVVIASLIGVLRGNSIPALAQRAAAAGWDLGPAALFVARHSKVLSIGVLVLGFVVLIAWSNPTPLVLLIISLVVVVLVGAILFVSSQSALVAGKPVPAGSDAAGPNSDG